MRIPEADRPDDAPQKSLDFYETMTAMHHTVLNLLAAGVFHLFEQQAGTLLQEWTGTRPKYPFSALDELLKNKNGPPIDVKAAPSGLVDFSDEAVSGRPCRGRLRSFTLNGGSH